MSVQILTDPKYKTPDLTINIPTIEKIINKKIFGVIHVGANYGEETNWYRINDIKNVIWVEPLKSGFDQLKVLNEIYGDKIFNCAISDFDGESEMFSVHNVVSSSLRQVAKHNLMCPLYVIDKPKVAVKKLDTLIDENNIDINNYNMLNIDTQGTEDLVLKGCQKYLSKFDVLYIEVNDKDVYDGTPDKNEVTKTLIKNNFSLVESVKVNALQYENVYVRSDLI